MTQDWSKELQYKLGLVVHAFNSSTQEAEAGRALWVQGDRGLHTEFQDGQGYRGMLSRKDF